MIFINNVVEFAGMFGIVFLLLISHQVLGQDELAIGMSNQGRIVGGQRVNITDVPYQVSLQRSNNHFCGGSIISNRWILTAAHCTQSFILTPRSLKVLIGATNVRTDGTLFDIQKIVVHPRYNSPDYDYSLIQIENEIIFNDKHRAISLPETDEEVEDGIECYVSGWGDTKNSKEDKIYLRAAYIPTVNHEKCQRKYILFGEVSDRMICAGFEEGRKDSCQGDSGGPMVHDEKLIGVVSWGKGCAEPGFPGVYAKVSSVRNWIKYVTGI